MLKLAWASFSACNGIYSLLPLIKPRKLLSLSPATGDSSSSNTVHGLAWRVLVGLSARCPTAAAQTLVDQHHRLATLLQHGGDRLDVDLAPASSTVAGNGASDQ